MLISILYLINCQIPGINDMVDSSLFGNTRFKVVCNDFCLGEVRKVLKDEVDVICII